ncbi:hypothetical protein SMICM304S_02814 [Streptomyces microflavus]
MMRRPSMPFPRTRPGRYVSTKASRLILRSATSWSTTTATKVLVLLPIRTWPSLGTFAPVVRSPTPAV